MLIESNEVARRRGSNPSSKRNVSFKCFLITNAGKFRVCRDMFMNTLGVGVWVFKKWAHPGENETIPKQKPEKARRSVCKSIEEFLDKLPKMESHYCRKRTTKLYLEPIWTSKKQLYEAYTELHPQNRGSCTTFHKIFEDRNLSLFHPKKDMCETCESFKRKNVSQEKYDEHIRKKNEARRELEADMIDDNKIVLTMDLQAVLLCPWSKVSTMYYKTKLIIHNFTIYNNKSNKGHCYLWNEVEAGLNGSEFASIIVGFLEANYANTTKTIVIYSDGCTYQNRNSCIANALLNFAKIHDVHLVQKFLEKGHTQMEADSMHAAIERQIKKRQIISVPFDYVEICATANRKNPYEVTYLRNAMFKKMDCTELEVYKTIRPGKKKGDPCVTDIRQILYKGGEIKVKLNHTGEWQSLPTRPAKKDPIPFEDIPCLKKRIPLKQKKFQHLQDLKLVIDQDYHQFYDSLPQEKS